MISKKTISKFLLLFLFQFSLGPALSWAQKLDYVTVSYQKALEFESQRNYQEAVKLLKELIGLEPNNAEFYFHLGRLYAWQKEYELAETHLNKCLELDPDYLDSRLMLGEIKFWQGKFAEAKAEFEKIIKKQPHHIGALKAVAKVYQKLNDWEKAEAVITKVLSLETGNFDLAEELGRIRYQLKWPVGTVVMKKNPQALEVADLMQAALLCKERKDHPRAAQYFEFLHQLIPKEGQLFFDLAEETFWNNDQVGAERYFKSYLEAVGENAEVYRMLAQIYFAKGENNQAEKFLQKSLRVDPNNYESQKFLGIVQFQMGKADKNFDWNQEVTSENVSEFLNFALTNKKQKDFEKAIKVYEKLNQRFPDEGDYHFALGELYFWTKQWEKAEAFLKKFVELSPEDEQTNRMLGQLMVQKNDLRGAEFHFKKALDVNPRDFDLANQLGNIRYKLQKEDEENKVAARVSTNVGVVAPKQMTILMLPDILCQALRLKEAHDYESAIVLYQALHEAFPESSDYLFQLGQLYYFSQKFDLAQEYLNQYLKISPDNTEALDILGFVYWEKGEYQRAQGLLEEESGRAPQNINLHIILGRIAWQLQEFAKCENHFKQILVLDSSHNEIKAYLDFVAQYQKVLRADDAQKQPEGLKLPVFEEKDQVYTRDIVGKIEEQAKSFEEEQAYQKSIGLYTALYERFPQNADYLFFLSQNYLRLENLNEAEQFASKCISLAPAYTDARRLLGNIYFWQQEFEKAKAEYEQVVLERPNDTEVLLQLGMAHWNLKEKDQAEELFRKILAMEPNNLDAAKRLAQLLFIEERLDESEAIFLKILEQDTGNLMIKRQLLNVRVYRATSQKISQKGAAQKENVQSLIDTLATLREAMEMSRELGLSVEYDTEYNFQLGRLYAWTEEYQKAEEYLAKVLTENTQHTDARILLGSVLIWQDRFEEAKGFIEGVFKYDQKNPSAYLALGNLYLSTKQYVLAEENFNNVLNSDAKNMDALTQLGRLYFIQERYPESEKIFRKVVGVDSTNDTARQFLEEIAHYQATIRANQLRDRREGDLKSALDQVETQIRGEDAFKFKQVLELEKKGAYQKAVELCQELHKMDSQNTDYLFQLGRLYASLEEWDEAAGYIQKILLINPDHFDAKVMLANLRLWQKDFQRAKQAFSDLRKKFPDNAEIYVGLGKIAQNEQRDDLAKHYFSVAYELDPVNIEALRYLGQIALADKDYKDAEQKFNKMIELDAENKIAKDFLDELKDYLDPKRRAMKAQIDKVEQQDDILNRLTERRVNQLEKEKRFAEAIGLLEELAQKVPGNGEYQFQLGRLYTWTGQHQKAIDTIKQGLVLNPDNLEARTILGNLQLWEKNYDEAISELSMVKEKPGVKQDVLLALAQAEAQKGQYPAAEENFRAVIDKDSHQLDAVNQLAQMKVKEGKLKEAEKLFTKVKDRDSQNIVAKKYLDDLKPVTHTTATSYVTYGREREVNQDLKKVETQLSSLEQGLRFVTPIVKKTRLVGGVSSGLQREENRIQKTKNYDVDVQKGELELQYFPNEVVTLAAGAGVNDYENVTNNSIFSFVEEQRIDPKVSLKFVKDQHFFLVSLYLDEFVAKDFGRTNSGLIERDNYSVVYEHRIKPSQSWGLSNSVHQYHDKVDNQEDRVAAWVKTDVPYLQDWLDIKYQLGYRDFKKDVVEYYSFDHQYEHSLQLGTRRSLGDTTELELAYQYSWVRTLELFNSGRQLGSNGTSASQESWEFVRGNEFQLQLKQKILNDMMLEIVADYYWDSNEYQTASFTGSVVTRF